jgi:hypothetical protein
MRFGILGPTQVWRDDGSELAVGGPRVRALLARLLIDPGTVIGTKRLIDDLSRGAPAATPGRHRHPLPLAVGWPVLLVAVFAPLAVRRYRRLSR